MIAQEMQHRGRRQSVDRLATRAEVAHESWPPWQLARSEVPGMLAGDGARVGAATETQPLTGPVATPVARVRPVEQLTFDHDKPLVVVGMPLV
jgi:hypothetical protein